MTIQREPTVHFQKGRSSPPSCLCCYTLPFSVERILDMCRQEQPVSPHFLIGPEGNVIQLVEIQDTARMEGQKEGEISILFSLEEDFSQAQLTAAASLFRMIREEVFRRYRLDLELDEKHIHWMDRVPAGFSFDRNRRTPLSQNEKGFRAGICMSAKSPLPAEKLSKRKNLLSILPGRKKKNRKKPVPRRPVPGRSWNRCFPTGRDCGS